MVISRASQVGSAALLVAACALPSADEFATANADAGSGSSSSGNASSDGGPTSHDSALPAESDGGADTSPPPAVVNLLSQNFGDFEAGCDDSGRYEAEVFASDGAHSGSGACKVCRASGSPTTDLWSIDNGFNTTPQVGQTYRATVWIRRPAGATDELRVYLALRSQGRNGAQVELAESEGLTLTDQWQQLATSLTLTKPARMMDTYTYADNKDGLAVPCFVVDDYVVWLE